MKAFLRIWNIITTLLVIAAVAFALLLTGLRLTGLQTYALRVSSMEQDYPVGSLICVKSADHTGLKEGDIVTFMPEKDAVDVGRITAVVPEENDSGVIRYRIQGDGASAEERLVLYKNVLGVPVLTIPVLGDIAAGVKEPPGSWAAVLCGVLLLLLVFLPELMAPEKRKRRRKKGGKYLKT